MWTNGTTRGCDNVETYNKKTMLICCLLVLVVFAFGWLLFRHYRNAGTATGHDATVTIQQIEGDNQSARHDINESSSQIGLAQEELNKSIDGINAATDTVNQLQDSVDDNERTLDECQQLISDSRGDIEEARKILADIDSTNQTTGASR